jgi:DMSO/TMAO reductase YedYZ molybdopterin-dependent catalytic subunit
MKRLLFGALLLLVLVSCSPLATGEIEESRAAPGEQSPPLPTAPAVQPSPLPTAPSTEDPDEVPFSIEEMHPADVDNSTLPITPVEELNRTGKPQEYDLDDYRLVVDGLVENPLSLSYEDLLSRPEVTETVLLICPGFVWDNATWTGTPLSLILEEAGVSPEATKVRFVAGDGYRQTLSLEYAMADGVFLAYEVNGETLPTEHGYPIRLVVRHQYGSKWVKWLESIEVEA